MSPDNRQHRGPGPKDSQLFREEVIPLLSAAAVDLCWLLDKEYAEKASLKLVGDRYKLQERQRKALARSCQSNQMTESILSHRALNANHLSNKHIVIDGFNMLITLEALLGGAPLFQGRDGVLRDLSGVHGSYRKIEETPQAIALIANYLEEHHAGPVLWIFDKPVSNSGRLAQLVKNTGDKLGLEWQIELTNQADQLIVAAPGIVLTSDSQILARCQRWYNLMEHLSSEMQRGWVIKLFGNG